MTDETAALQQRIRELEAELAAQKAIFEDHETRYRSLFDAAFEGISIHENGIIIDTNYANAAMFGYEPEELIGKPILDLTAEGWEQTVIDNVTAAKSDTYEMKGRRKDGTIIDLEVTGKTYQYQGRPVRVAGVRDVTARKQLEALQKEQQTFLEALRDTAAILNSTLDPEIVMKRILNNVGKVVPHDAANIMLMEGEISHIRYWHGYYEKDILFFRDHEIDLSKFKTLQMMLESKQPIVIPDTSQFEGWQARDVFLQIKSYAGAPIQVDGNIIGFINLDSATPNALTATHAERLQAFADQAAIAIKNARLYDDSLRQAIALQLEVEEREQAEANLERRNRLLETLNELSREAYTRLEVGHILDTVARLTAQTIDATSAYVLDWDEPTGLATVLADYVSPNANPLERVSDKGVTYNMYEEFHDFADWMRTPEGYSIRSLDDPELDPGERQHLLNYGGYITMYVPLWADGKPVGYLEVWDSRAGRQFSKDDTEMAVAVARQVSTSIGQARLHEALLDSEARNRATLNAIPDAMFRLNREGHYLDAHLPPVARYTSEEVIGKNIFFLMPPAVAEEGLAHIRNALATGRMEIFEYQLANESGDEMRDFEARIAVCGPDDVLVIVRDITRRKQAQIELSRARDEALEASRIKTQFLTNISHELRTPLNSIINYTELLLEGIYGNMSAIQLDRLEKVRRNGRSLLALINDVLDLSRIEGGQMSLRQRPVDAKDFIHGIIEAFEPMAAEKDLTLTYEGGDIADLYVDEARARQVLTNLIGNGIKFTHEGGVTIRTRLKDGMLEFAVTDTGIGIPAEMRDIIFDDFRQADNTATRQYEGTGLGLTISKHLVEMHGGMISVESEPGRGSTFYVSFPIASVEASV